MFYLHLMTDPVCSVIMQFPEKRVESSNQTYAMIDRLVYDSVC